MSTIIIMFNRCEDVELAAPGNNQDNPSVAPAGAIIWDENNVILEDGKALFPENSAAGVTIGRLNATDKNTTEKILQDLKISVKPKTIAFSGDFGDDGNL